MGTCIIKIEEWYFEYSSVVDAPVTYAMTMEELKEYVKEEYGRRGLEDLPMRLERVGKHGTSSRNHTSVDDVIAYNRAGPNETKLTKKQILERFRDERSYKEFKK